MARTKQYATAAERQAAYRERQRANVTNVTPCTMMTRCILISPDAAALMTALSSQGWEVVRTEQVDWYGGMHLYYHQKDSYQVFIALRKDGTGEVVISPVSGEGDISELVEHVRGTA